MTIVLLLNTQIVGSDASKFRSVKTASTPMEISKPLMNDENAEDVDVHLYRSMIGSLMYLTSSRPDIIFVDSPFDLEAYTNSDYVGASLDRKSTTGGCQFLRCRLISWQCKKQTVVANSINEAEYAMEGEGSGQPTEPQHTPTTASPSHVEPIPTIASSSHPKKTHKHRKTKRKSIEISQSSRLEQDKLRKGDRKAKPKQQNRTRNGKDCERQSQIEAENVKSTNHGPTTLVADETVHKEKGDNMERAATTAISLNAEQGSGNIIRTQSMATLNEPIPQGTGSGSGPRRQDTILRDRPAQTRFKRLSKQSNDPPLLRINTLGSEENSMKLNELMEICINLSERVLVLENIKTAQDLEITNLKKRVKKLEKKKKSRTSQLKRRLFKVKIESSAKKSLGDQEDASKQGRNEIDQDEEISWFQDDAETQGRAPVATAGVSTLMKMRSVNTKEKSKEKGVSSKTATRPIVSPQQQLNLKDKGKGIMQEPEKPVKVKGKDQIEYDADVAQRLQVELDEEVRLERESEEEAGNAALIEEWDTIESRIDADAQLAERLQAEEREHMFVEERARLLMELFATRTKFFSAKRAKEQRNKPPTKAKQRNKMCTYMKHMAGYKDKNSRKKAVSKKRIGERPSEESVKKQKIEDDVEKAKLKACLEIVPEDKMYYQIIKADGSTKYYKIFSAMLDDFDRQDVLDLYRLVKERFESTSPEGYDRLLWGDLITLFKPSEEDEIWKAQQDYTLICRRLYDSCGVHLLLMGTGITIHMLVENKYTLTQEMLLRMLSRRLEVDHECEMAFKLLRFIKSQYKK
ncbi:uncharacterized mitochondrial protein-like protein [Tanacetum coccineum]